MKYYVGVDIGGTNSKIGIVSEDGKLLNSKSIKTLSNKGYEHTILNISNEIKQMVNDLKISDESIVAIGIGVPGPVMKNSTVKFFANFDWPINLNISKEFKKHFSKEVFVDNDVNVIGLGENFNGSSKGYNNILTVAVGTGIGAGLIINGMSVSGKNGAAGEIGHIKLEKDGLLCGCGQKGCYEAYSSATGIVREAMSRLCVNKNNKLYEIYKKNGEIETKDIFDLAKSGDEFSLEIVDYVVDNLGLGISNALNLIDPEILVIGGGISLAKDFLLEKLMKSLRKYTLPIVLENLEIKMAVLGNDAGIYGAAYLAKKLIDKE